MKRQPCRHCGRRLRATIDVDGLLRVPDHKTTNHADTWQRPWCRGSSEMLAVPLTFRGRPFNPWTGEFVLR